MMSSTAGYPQWVLEFRRSLSINTVFCLHGNIHDLVPLSGDGDGQPTPSYFSLREFLSRFLTSTGYEIVGIYDIVDGLRLAESRSRSMEAQCERLEQLCSNRKSAAKVENLQRLYSSMLEPSRALDLIRDVLANRKEPVVFILDYASLLSGSHDGLGDEERRLFLKIAKSAHEAGTVRQGSDVLQNLLILIAEKLNDIPPWLHLNNPLFKTLLVERPDEEQRREFFKACYPCFFGSSSIETEQTAHVNLLTELTHGMMIRELQSIIDLSKAEQIPPGQTRQLVELFKFGVRESPWERLLSDEGRRLEFQQAEERLEASVKGQKPAVRAVVDILKRATQGLSGTQHSTKTQRPKGVLFFAGPTGVGKTELAKAIARLLFGDETACIRFDMSEYSQEHNDQRLFGAPPGYIGYDVGGQLTNRVKQNPFCVLLFDEIEKAHPAILDKFLQILDDGRLTSGQGETIYFSECILIFTSNKGMFRTVRNDVTGRAYTVPNIRPYGWQCSCGAPFFFSEEQSPACPKCQRPVSKSTETPYSVIQEELLKALKDYFTLEIQRPELFNRFGNNFVVFDYIRPGVRREIVRKMLGEIRQTVFARRGISLDFSAVEDAIIEQAATTIEQGGRGIGNMLETMVVNPLARQLFDKKIANGARLKITEIRPAHSDAQTHWELDWTEA